MSVLALLSMPFGKILVTHFINLVVPGSNFALILRNSFVFSRRKGLMTALGTTTGEIIQVGFAVFGFVYIISQSPRVMQIVTWMGIVFLLYMGYESLRAKPRNPNELDFENASADTTVADTTELKDSKAYFQGLLTMLLNPRCTLFYLTIFTSLASTPLTFWEKAVCQIWFPLSVCLWFSSVAYIFSNVAIRRRFIAWAHWLERITGIVFIWFAYMLAKGSF